MNKYLPMIAAVVLMSPAMAFALECAEGEVEVPAVTHTEEVESCEFKGNWQFGLNSQCNGQWQFRQSAYHEVTEEVEVVDEPAYCAIPEPEPEEPSEGGSEEPSQSQPTSGGGGPCHPSTGFPECQQNKAYFAWKAHVDLYELLVAKLQQLVWELQAQN
jgi:hypothetical protein